MAKPEAGDVTTLLLQWRNGDRAALDALVPLIYRQLRQVAHARLRAEREGHALQTTELVHEVHCDVRRGASFADFVHLADERVIEPRGGPRLAVDASAVIGIMWLRMQELECDGAAKALVVGAVNLAHAAGAEPLLHLVGANHLAGAFDVRCRLSRCEWCVLEEAASTIVRGDQSLDALAQIEVVATRGVEEGAASVFLDREGRFQELS